MGGAIVAIGPVIAEIGVIATNPITAVEDLADSAVRRSQSIDATNWSCFGRGD
jgi:hypothetical protein